MVGGWEDRGRVFDSQIVLGRKQSVPGTVLSRQFENDAENPLMADLTLSPPRIIRMTTASKRMGNSLSRLFQREAMAVPATCSQGPVLDHVLPIGLTDGRMA